MPEDVPIACNHNAIPPDDQNRYRDLMSRLRASIAARIELPLGYSYALNTQSLSLPELADWVTLERLCCPFVNFLIEIDAAGAVHLTVRGPEGRQACVGRGVFGLT